MNAVVSVEWLQANLDDPDLILLDASPLDTIGGESSEFGEITIPSARPFDLKGNFTDKESPFPNTVPSAAQFEIQSRKLGINNSSKVVAFDNLGIYTGPRVWWLFKIMGHTKVYVLNGGLPEWIHQGFPTVSKVTSKYELGNFKATFSNEYVKSYHDVLDNVDTNTFTIIDARSEGRFNGTAKEPRKHLKSGHIPNSVNIPYQSVLENGKFKSEVELQQIFKKKVADKGKDLVYSCGSGLTACIVMMASEQAFKKGKYIYDGSWTEWAELQNLKENPQSDHK